MKSILHLESQGAMPSSPARESLCVRWALRRDTADILAIDAASSITPWSREDLLTLLLDRNVIGKVIESGRQSAFAQQVLGFNVYELHKDRLVIINLAIAPDHRRGGLGRLLINDLIRKLSFQRRRKIEIVVAESNLDSHLFLRRCGFIATDVLRGHYCEGLVDGYRFEFYL